MSEKLPESPLIEIRFQAKEGICRLYSDRLKVSEASDRVVVDINLSYIGAVHLRDWLLNRFPI